jgi:hypothetical protein
MTNTVIGDSLTLLQMETKRMYKAPVICSEYVKADIIGNVENHAWSSLNWTCEGQGKDEGKRVYSPIPKNIITAAMRRDMKKYSRRCGSLTGDWKRSAVLYGNAPLRGGGVSPGPGGRAPSNWNGIWAMDSK